MNAAKFDHPHGYVPGAAYRASLSIPRVATRSYTLPPRIQWTRLMIGWTIWLVACYTAGYFHVFGE